MIKSKTRSKKVSKRAKTRRNPNSFSDLRKELIEHLNYSSYLKNDAREKDHLKLLTSEIQNLEVTNQLELDELIITLAVREQLYKDLYNIASKYRK